MRLNRILIGKKHVWKKKPFTGKLEECRNII